MINIRIFKLICSVCFFVMLIGVSFTPSAAPKNEPVYSALHPAGAYLPQVNSVPLVPHLSGVEGKIIYPITINSPKDPAMDSLAVKVERMLTERSTNRVPLSTNGPCSL